MWWRSDGPSDWCLRPLYRHHWWVDCYNSGFDDHRRIDVSNHCIARISDRTDAAESMSLINGHIYIYIYIDPMIIIFIVISTGHNFEIQMVNSNLTLNPLLNSNINVIFFLTLNSMVNSNLKVIFFNFKPNGKFKTKGQIFEIQTQITFLLYKYDHFLSNFHPLLQNYLFHSVFVLS